METYLEKLILSDPLRDPVIRRAIRELGLPKGSRGLDAGCGIGSHTLLLAEAVGPGGHVTGLDQSAEFVAHARALAEQSDLTERVSFRRGNVSELPFDDNSFDWAWSVDCVGHSTVGEPLAGPTARTVVGTVQAPLDEGVRRALISLFGMLWGEMQPRMTEENQ
jgi:demethylmenaquinone methyltransferase/2-methoxy-6-polyprenyl-1,4-benzoquinol methylase